VTELVILTTASVYIGLPIREVRMVQPSAQNASNFPVYDAQFWYSGDPGSLSGPDDLGTIMPAPQASTAGRCATTKPSSTRSSRSATPESVRWMRTACGDLEEQTHGT